MFKILLRYFGAALFFLMLVAPFEMYSFKISIIVILVLVQLVLILKHRRVSLSIEIINWFFVLLFFGIFFTFWSLFFPQTNFLNVLKITPVYVVWPIVYLLFLPFLKSESILRMIFKTMVYGAIFISIYLLLAFLSLSGLSSIPFDSFTLVKPILGRTETGEAQLFMPAVTSLLFLNPFLLSGILLRTNHFFKINQNIILIAFLLSTIAIFISGRRSLMLNILIAPLVLRILMRYSKLKLHLEDKKMAIKISVLILLLVSIIMVYLSNIEIINLNSFWDFFVSGFDLRSNGGDESSSLRGEQFYQLIKSWLDYPLLGSGLASPSQYIVRNDEMPWMYELSYLAWLFQTGLVGFVIYMSLLFWILVKAINIVRINNRYSFLIPFCVGYFCFLIACATNPYSQAYDHMWAILLPVGVINYCIIDIQKQIDR